LGQILGLGTALPPHRLDPEPSRELLQRVFPRLRGSELQPVTRYLVDEPGRLLCPRPLGQSMRVYAEEASRLAGEASRCALTRAGVAPGEIDAIISVSCTGYLVPSLDVRLVHDLGLRADVVRLPITELGCSGGLAALSFAHRHLEARPGDRVLVVAVELCSLSFRPHDASLDNLMASMVFGDGAGAAVLGGGPCAGGLELVAASQRLLPHSARYLGFELEDDGFHVVLDSRLPRVLASALEPAVDEFWRDEAGPSFYAVHAAGPRVFDAVEGALGLPPDALAASRHLFERVGNLSSASILFALAELDEAVGDGLALAFGPGVTVELARLRRSPE
jgi:predicted naringenin-chalcone synthase